MNQELSNKLIGYQLKANEYTQLIEQAKKDNEQILVDAYTELRDQYNRLIDLINSNL
jgi:hypothetical protein